MRADRGQRRWSREGVQLMSIRGIPIVIHASWVVSVAVLSSFTAPTIAEDLVGDSSTFALVVVAVLAVLPIAACIVLHELAHALVARAWGLRVARITLFAFGGVSMIEGNAPTPAAEYAIAASGPLVSLTLASGLGLLARSAHAGPIEIAGGVAIYAYVNLALALFNLIPAFPMDGGRLLRSVIWKLNGDRARATTWAARVGRGFATVLIASGLYVALSPLATRGQPDTSGLWTVLIGMFIFSASLDAERIEKGDR